MPNNVILTSSGFVDGPDFEEEEPPMAEQPAFPKHLYAKDEPQNRVKDSATGEDLCGSRLFQSQEEVAAAGGNAVWKATPQEAAAASTPPATARPTPPVPPVPDPDEDEPHAPRSRR